MSACAAGLPYDQLCLLIASQARLDAAPHSTPPAA
jgi:hypothetical protein